MQNTDVHYFTNAMSSRPAHTWKMVAQLPPTQLGAPLIGHKRTRRRERPQVLYTASDVLSFLWL